MWEELELFRWKVIKDNWRQKKQSKRTWVCVRKWEKPEGQAVGRVQRDEEDGQAWIGACMVRQTRVRISYFILSIAWKCWSFSNKSMSWFYFIFYFIKISLLLNEKWSVGSKSRTKSLSQMVPKATEAQTVSGSVTFIWPNIYGHLRQLVSAFCLAYQVAFNCWLD